MPFVSGRADGSQVRRLQNTAKAIYHTQPCIVSYLNAIAELAGGHLKDCYFDSFVNTAWAFAKVGLASPEFVDGILRWLTVA